MWDVRTLQEICEKITDGTHQTPKYFDEGYIFLSSKNVKTGKIDWNDVKFIDGQQHEAMQSRLSPKKGDILLAKNGTTGVAAIVDRGDVEFDIYVSLALLRCKATAIPEYVLYFINSRLAKEQFNKRLKGAGVPNLHLKEIREVNIPLAPLPEQERIVAILDEAFEGIDAAIANTQANLTAARELFESDLNLSVFQKGDVRQERELSEVCEITSVLIDPKLPQYAHLAHVGAGNIKAKTGELENIRTAEEEQLISGKFLFDNTMVLYSKIRPYLEKVVRPEFEGLCSADIYPLKPKPGLDRNFLFFMLLSRKFTDYAILGSGRAGMPKVNRNHLFKFPCSIPPIGKQIEIAQRLDFLLEETCKLQKVYQRKLDALHELKQSILAKAFRGELTQEEIAA